MLSSLFILLLLFIIAVIDVTSTASSSRRIIATAAPKTTTTTPERQQGPVLDNDHTDAPIVQQQQQAELNNNVAENNNDPPIDLDEQQSPVTTVVSHHDGPIKVFTRTIMDARRHLAAAAVARSTSIFAMYPVDTIKTRMQMEQSNPFRLGGILNGVGGSLIGQVPYGVLTFGSYEMYKQVLLDKFPNVKPIFKYATAAILGDLTGSGWLCPSEVIKQKVQAGMYKSTTDAITNIWQKKGFIGFYEGYIGGVTRDVPFRVAQLTTYEITKNLYLRIKTKKRKTNNNNSNEIVLSPIEAATCGAVAGTFSAAVTAPLDRFKTLLMTDSTAYGGTVASCAAKIWKEEGVRGLMTGVVPRVVYIAPSVVIFFVAYEMTQQRLSHWKVSASKD